MGINDIRMREKLKNELYSEILFKINSRSVSVTAFSEEFNKSRISLRDNILALEKDNYLIREDKGKLKYFTINWKRIIKEFLHYLKERNKVRYNEIDKNLLKNITKNKILQEYFKQYFFMYWKRAIGEFPEDSKSKEHTGNKTVYGFFMDSLYLNDETLIKGILNKDNNEVREFLRFIKEWKNFYFRNYEFIHSQNEVLKNLEYKFGEYGENCKREKRDQRISKLKEILKPILELKEKRDNAFDELFNTINQANESKLSKIRKSLFGKSKDNQTTTFEELWNSFKPTEEKKKEIESKVNGKDSQALYNELEILEGWNANEDFKKEEKRLKKELKKKGIKTTSVTI
jgi:hypothetical protein